MSLEESGTAESRDTAASTPAPSQAEHPPQPPASILHKSSSSESGSSSPQHHVRICKSGIPPISPRVHKERSSLKNLQHSPRVSRKDRSMSLGAYPPSWGNVSSGNVGMSFVPLSPYSPSASPIAAGSVYAGVANNNSMPYMPNLSHAGPTRAAMEAAVHSERERSKEKEKEEETMDADELRAVLKRERIRMSKIQADLAALRAAAVQSQAEAEVHEEGRINNLMRRVECLQQEKGSIIVELEREEEMLTNTLQKKLDEVKREKMLLEQQIEREQSSHGELKSKLTTIRSSKAETSSSGNGKEDGVVEKKNTATHPETILESEDEQEEDAECE